MIAAVGAVRAARRCAVPLRRSHLARPAGASSSAASAALGALLLLVRDAARGARVLAVVAVAGAVVAWGVAQWPYLLPESLTFAAAAAPSGTLTAVLVAVVLAAVIVLPGFVLLYVLDQRGLLPEEGVDDAELIGRPATEPARDSSSVGVMPRRSARPRWKYGDVPLADDPKDGVMSLTHLAVPADRRLRVPVELPHRGAGRAGRLGRLAVRARVRLAQRRSGTSSTAAQAPSGSVPTASMCPPRGRTCPAPTS